MRKEEEEGGEEEEKDPCRGLPTESKCLFVDNLPSQYRDMAEFRRVFSVVAKPPYCQVHKEDFSKKNKLTCETIFSFHNTFSDSIMIFSYPCPFPQIAMKNGVIQSWGLVEFTSAEDTEATLDRADGTELLPGQPIRVQFCTPGVRAISIYMDFVNNPMDAVASRERKALLEEAPSTRVYDQLESLAKHNPWFVQNLQRIMSSSSLLPNGEAAPQHQTSVQSLPSTSTSSPAATAAPPPSTDPAQAALILLLAGRVAAGKSSPAQTASLLKVVLQRMEAGASAAEVLAEVTAEEQQQQHQHQRPVLLDTPGQQQQQQQNGKKDLSEVISSLVKSSQEMLKQSNSNSPSASLLPNPPPPTASPPSRMDPNKRDPTLTDLLLKSFQARVRKGVYSPQQGGGGGAVRMRGQAPNGNRSRFGPPTASSTVGSSSSRAEVFKYHQHQQHRSPTAVSSPNTATVPVPAPTVPLPCPPPSPAAAAAAAAAAAMAPLPVPPPTVAPALSPGVGFFQAQLEHQQQQQQLEQQSLVLAAAAAASSPNPFLPFSAAAAQQQASSLLFPTAQSPFPAPHNPAVAPATQWPMTTSAAAAATPTPPPTPSPQQQYCLQQAAVLATSAGGGAYPNYAFQPENMLVNALAQQQQQQLSYDVSGGKRKSDSWEDIQAKRAKMAFQGAASGSIHQGHQHQFPGFVAVPGFTKT